MRSKTLTLFADSIELFAHLYNVLNLKGTSNNILARYIQYDSGVEKGKEVLFYRKKYG